VSVSRLPGEGSCYRDRIPVSIPREAEDTSSRARRNAQKSAKRTKDFAYTDNKGFTDSEAVSLIFAICPQSEVAVFALEKSARIDLIGLSVYPLGLIFF
jgi:hypothetical protein